MQPSTPDQNEIELQLRANCLISTLMIASLTLGLLCFFIGHSTHAPATSFRSSLPLMFFFSVLITGAFYFYAKWLLSFTRFKSLLTLHQKMNYSQLNAHFNNSFNDPFKYHHESSPLSLDARWNSLREIDPFYKTTGHIPNTDHLN